MDISLGPRVLWELPFLGISITETILGIWIIGAILIAFSIFATSNLKIVPSGVQLGVEAFVDSMNNLTIDTMGSDKRGFAPYITFLFLFLAVSNISGFFGMRPPTADVQMTFALAGITFFMVHFFAIKRKGTKGYLKSYLEPLPPMLPINIISEIANPVSLSFRLFGNIVGGFIIMTLVYGALANVSAMIGLESLPILQIGIPLPLHLYFDLFAGILQSFIFTMLTMIFVAMAMD